MDIFRLLEICIVLIDFYTACYFHVCKTTPTFQFLADMTFKVELDVTYDSLIHRSVNVFNYFPGDRGYSHSTF